MTHDQEVALAQRILVALGLAVAAIAVASFAAWPEVTTEFVITTAIAVAFLAALGAVVWACETLSDDRRRRMRR